METKVNLIENRLFVRLDNEWYLVNKHNRTTNILIGDIGFEVQHRDGTSYGYTEIKKKDDLYFTLTVYDDDTFPVMVNNRITFDDIKKMSVKNLSDDAEGMYIWNWLNSKGIPWEVK